MTKNEISINKVPRGKLIKSIAEKLKKEFKKEFEIDFGKELLIYYVRLYTKDNVVIISFQKKELEDEKPSFLIEKEIEDKLKPAIRRL